MKNPYPNEKFSAAVDTLATSPKSIQERICDAYICSLIHVKPDEVPEHIRYEFDQLRTRLTSVEPKGEEGSVAATTSLMSTDEAIEIAQLIKHVAYVIRCDYEEK